MAVQIPFPLPSHGYALNSKMRINLDFLVDQFNQFNTGSATWDTVAIGTANNLTGTLTFYNASTAYYIAFQPGATAANVTYTLPTAVPASAGLLSSNSSGVMSWLSGTGILYNTNNFSGAAAQNHTLPLVSTSGVVTLADHQYNVTAASNGLLYIPSGVEVKALANALGVTAVVGISSAGTPAAKTLNSTTNQVTVTANANDFTFSTPQDIGTSSNVQFGTVKAGAGSYASPAFYFTSSSSNVVGFYTDGTGTALNLRVGAAIGSVVWSADNSGNVVATGETRSATFRATTNYQVSTGAGPIVTMQGPSSGSTWTFTLPTSGGTVDYVLRTDGSGTTSWVSVGSTGGATKALDNLASVAINTSLLAASDNAIDLGSTSKNWRTLYVSTSINNGSTTLATATELGYLSGVTSAIQTQFSGKASTALDNLASVAVNASLLPGTDNSIDLGSSSKQWKNAFLSTALTISATSNQIVLGTTRTVTITAGTPATSSRTWTIPDITGNGTFAALEGTQTFSGAKTFSATLTMSGATIAMGSQKITGLANGTASTDAAAFGQLKVLQVVAATTSTRTTTTSNTYQTTSLTVSITPSSSSNKVLIMASGSLLTNNGTVAAVATIFRDSTNLNTAGGSNYGFGYVIQGTTDALNAPWSAQVLDSPATTSAITYSVKVRNDDNATTVRFGDTGVLQSIVAMEIAA